MTGSCWIIPSNVHAYTQHLRTLQVTTCIIRLDYMDKESTFKKLENEHQKLSQVLETLKGDQELFRGERHELAERCALLEEEKSLAIEDKDYLIGILSDATLVLKQALEHKDPLQDPALSEKKNKDLLYKVVEILKVAVEMGVGIQMDDFVTKRMTATNRKKVGLCSQMTTRASQQPVAAAHYKIGDLGIVPPIKNNKKTKPKEKATYFTDEQLAKGTPQHSKYDLVKSPTLKLPKIASPVQ